MNRTLVVEYEVLAVGETVLSVVDKEKDEVLNMFKGKIAENIYRMLSNEEINKLYSVDSRRTDVIKDEMEKSVEEIINKMNLIIEAMEFVKKQMEMTVSNEEFLLSMSNGWFKTD